jgi:hypothetical protein
MRTVYIVNDGGHDYSASTHFGSLKFLTSGCVSKYNTGKMVRYIEEGLKDSHKDDYILLCSFSTLCSIACAIFAHMHGTLNLLIMKDGGYVERRLDFSRITNNKEKSNDYRN